MSDWTYHMYATIPIGARDNVAEMADKIMPDANEREMFDAIRLSASGKEPATHLATSCPLTPKLAESWQMLFFSLEQKPRDFPNIKVWDVLTLAKAEAIKLDAKFEMLITNRLENDKQTLIRGRKLDVRVKDSAKRTELSQIGNFSDFLKLINLQVIVID